MGAQFHFPSTVVGRCLTIVGRSLAIVGDVSPMFAMFGRCFAIFRQSVEMVGCFVAFTFSLNFADVR